MMKTTEQNGGTLTNASARMTAVTLQQQFARMFGTDAQVFRAPGRINLIGEHTDYNDGFVMPAAIDAATFCAMAKRTDRQLVLHSLNYHETVAFDLDEAVPRAQQHWSDYPRGVAVMLARAGFALPSANLLFHGEVPLGAGLSSSAAIEMATAGVLLASADKTLDCAELAQLCQRAESEFVGLRCGIMDQFISCHGRARYAMLLDCRTLAYRWLCLPDTVRLVVCNTMIRHTLANSEYNLRRADCELGVTRLAGLLPGITALRDVSLETLEAHRHALPEPIFRRCRHVVTENARTLAAAEALEQGDLQQFGELMDASHRSLRDDYEVSCPELDLLVRLASGIEGVYGARMMGGGFGGSTINLVRADCVAAFSQAVATEYGKATGTAPEIYAFAAADGAGRIA